MGNTTNAAYGQPYSNGHPLTPFAYDRNRSATSSSSGYLPRGDGVNVSHSTIPVDRSVIQSNALTDRFGLFSIANVDGHLANDKIIKRCSRETSNGQVMDVFDPRNGVMGTYQTEPKDVITDSQLYERGVRAYRSLQGTPNEEERLYSSETPTNDSSKLSIHTD